MCTWSTLARPVRQLARNKGSARTDNNNDDESASKRQLSGLQKWNSKALLLLTVYVKKPILGPKDIL